METMNRKKIYKFLTISSMVCISIFIRICCLPVISGDFIFFLQSWFDTLKENGGIFALKENLGDYNLPYVQIIAILTYIPIKALYSIKIVSIVFDYIGAIFMGLLIYEITKNKDNGVLAFFITLMLPTVILNSSAWAQCDFIYVTFIILSLLFLIKDKYFLSFIFLGIAFSFKLQTIFVLPVFILYYVSERKFPFYYFFIIPIMDIIMCLPSIIVGKPILDLLNVYINQTGEYSQYLSLNFPGIYCIFLDCIPNSHLIEMPNEIIKFVGIVIVGLVFFIVALFVFLKKIKFSYKSLVQFTVWSILICTYFLPEMHDRYMFSADVISVAVFFIDKKKWYLPVIVNISSLYTYLFYLFEKSYFNIRILSIGLGIGLIYYTFSIFKELLKDNKLEEGR